MSSISGKRYSNETLLPISSSLAGMGFSATWAFTSLFMYSSLGVSYFIAGAVFTLSGIVAALFQFLGGRLGDRFGHRGILLALILISTLLYILIFLVSDFFVIPLVFSILFVLSIAVNSAIISPMNSLVSLSSESPLKGFSYLRMGSNVGWGFGPMIGGAIFTFYGYPFIYILGLGMNIANIVIVMRVTEVKGKVTEPGSARIGHLNSMYIFLGVAVLLIFIIQGQESVTLPNFMSGIRHMTALDVGVIFFVNGLFVILLQPSVIRITSRIGLSRGFVLGTFLYAFGFFTMAFDYNLPEFIISMIVATIGENFSFPAANTIVTTLSRNENIGLQMGVLNAFKSVGRSIGPVVGGAALSNYSNPVLIWFLVTVSGLFSIIIYAIKLFRKVNTHEAGSNSTI